MCELCDFNNKFELDEIDCQRLCHEISKNPHLYYKNRIRSLKIALDDANHCLEYRLIKYTRIIAKYILFKEECKNKNKDLEKELEACKKKIKELEKSKKEKQDLEKELEKYKKENQELEKKFEECKNKTGDAKKLEELEGEVEMLRRRVRSGTRKEYIKNNDGSTGPLERETSTLYYDEEKRKPNIQINKDYNIENGQVTILTHKVWDEDGQLTKNDKYTEPSIPEDLLMKQVWELNGPEEIVLYYK